MTNNSKIQGNLLENEVCDWLYRSGYWVHKMVQNEVGQPADIIAVKNGLAYVFDCKACSSNRFELMRIEPNQETAMNYWASKGNPEGLFVIKFYEEESPLFVVPLSYLLKIRKEHASITLQQLLELKDSGVDFTWNTWRCNH